MPATGYSTCLENNFATMIDPATGTFRIRSTGRPRAGSKLKRSLIASFRRRSFLDFLYFTDFETTDPINYAQQPDVGAGQLRRRTVPRDDGGPTTAARRSSSPTRTRSTARSTPTTTS